MVTAIPFDEFRARIDEVLDTVIETEETVIVVMKDGRKVVLLPERQYASLDETSYLVSTMANRTALAQGMREANEGKMSDVNL